MSLPQRDDSNPLQNFSNTVDQEEASDIRRGTPEQSNTQGGQEHTVSMPGVSLNLKDPLISDLELHLDLFKKDQHCFVTGDMLEDLQVTPIISPEECFFSEDIDEPLKIESSFSRMGFGHPEAACFRLRGPQNAILLAPELHEHFLDGNFALVPSQEDRSRLRIALRGVNLAWRNMVIARRNASEVRPLDISQPPFTDISWEIVVLRPDVFPAPLYTYCSTLIDLDGDSKEDPSEDLTEYAWACYNSDRFLRSCEPATGHAHMPPFKHRTLRPPRDRPSPLALIIAGHNALKGWAENRDAGCCSDATTSQTGFKREDLPNEGPRVNAAGLEDLMEEVKELVELIIPQSAPSFVGLGATASSSRPSSTASETSNFWSRALQPFRGFLEAKTAPEVPSPRLGRAPPACSEGQRPLLDQPTFPQASPSSVEGLDASEQDSVRLNDQLLEGETCRALYLLDQHCFVSGEASENLRLWSIFDRFSGHASTTRSTETFLSNLRLHHPDTSEFSLSGLHNTLLVEPHLHRDLTETNAFIIIPSAHDRFRMLDALRTSNEAWQEELKWKPSQFVTRPLDVSQSEFSAVRWDIIVLDPSSFATHEDPFMRHDNPILQQNDEADDSFEIQDGTPCYEKSAWACFKYDHYLRAWDPIDAEKEMPSDQSRIMPSFQPSTLRHPPDRVSTLAMCVRASATMQAWKAKQSRPVGAQARKKAKKSKYRNKDHHQRAAADGKEAALEMIAEQLSNLSDAILYMPEAKSDVI